DRLQADFSQEESARLWASVFDQVTEAKMPPRKNSKLSKADAAILTGWIQGELKAFSKSLQKQNGRTLLRRLNRIEYENSVCDLLGIKADLRNLLPEDASVSGFDNSSDGQHFSSILLERYLEAADKALDHAIIHHSQPEFRSGIFRFDPATIPPYLTKSTLVLGDAMVLFNNVFALKGFKAHADGLYRIRIHTAGYPSSGKPVQFSVQEMVGSRADTRTLGFFEAPRDPVAPIEFTTLLRNQAQLRIAPYQFLVERVVPSIATDRSGVAIHSIHVEGPLVSEWPPISHRRIFGDLPLKPLRDGRFPLFGRGKASPSFAAVPRHEEEDIKRIIYGFLPRAFRRPVGNEEAELYIGLALAKLKAGGSFEDAIRVGFKSMLCSPAFLFLKELPGQLDGFALATRLSYFLWSTTPDEELLELAAKGVLSQPAVLRAQVERLLRDGKAHQFTENFTGQWLGLREIDATTPDKALYPEFDEWLQISMVEETHRFFEELLTHDLGVSNFIHSDFAMLNERLALHYGLGGVRGLEIRKVVLPPGSHRGGVLTQAAILKVTANGTTSSPVMRGAWVMRNIMGQPIPPPPEAVPAIEPDIRGATNIRDQLAKHRALAECASCHNRMDPPGLALENFDVI
ncbi:MAG: DUF1592 domain-containing protein, partial [Verrucomicrobiota bacterium]